MTMEVEEIVERIMTTAPRCIEKFKVEAAERPEPWDGDIAVWQLACGCGSSHGQFVG